MEKKKILIVEDEGIIAMGIKNKMANLGYTVTDMAFTGEEAVKKVEEQKPDLVLMDIKLAGKMDGIETAKKIREKFDIPVIYLTAFSDKETVQRAKITEPYGYIPKPVNEIDLKCNIEIALYRHHIKPELQRKKEMEAIGQFSLGIVHDFNNLLQGIVGYVDVAVDKCKNAGCESECLLLLEKALQRLNKTGDLIKLYEQIFNIQKYSLLNKEILTVPDIVTRIQSALERVREEKSLGNIPYNLEVSDRCIFTLRGDAGQLEDVFFHIICNAVEAMAGEETILPISISFHQMAVELENEWLLKPGSYIKISIQDKGKGIPGEDLNKIFIPYFSTKDEFTRKGMGLGMTICYSIIKQHEGHIAVQSELGKGTAVDLFLPIL
ncbi:MAG: response regulator [Acidobacteria bacterium]|jgi:signal transduction histidine kinase|nr:response regulator [Acidobacteriota bacterium]